VVRQCTAGKTRLKQTSTAKFLPHNNLRGHIHRGNRSSGLQTSTITSRIADQQRGLAVVRKLRLRVAVSLDGFIADVNGGVDWIDRFHGEGAREDYGMAFFHEIDTVLMGRHTHDFALSHGRSSYPGMENFVFTRSKTAGKRDGVEYLSGEPRI
jgi:hypothetical protein